MIEMTLCEVKEIINPEGMEEQEDITPSALSLCSNPPKAEGGNFTAVQNTKPKIRLHIPPSQFIDKGIRFACLAMLQPKLASPGHHGGR